MLSAKRRRQSSTTTSCTIPVLETKETWLNLLEFMYTGKLANPKMFTLDVLEAAHKYDVYDLVDQCTSYLKKTLCQENCVTTFVVADRNANAVLRAEAKDFILRDSTMLARSDAWKEELRMSPKLLTELLEGVVSSHRRQCFKTYILLEEAADGTMVAKRKRKYQ